MANVTGSLLGGATINYANTPTPASSSVAKPGALGLLNQYQAPAMPAAKTGTVPQVYSGSTGSGSNQNTSTQNYGGYTPTVYQGGQSMPTRNADGSLAGSSGSNQSASVFNAFGGGTANAQTNNSQSSYLGGNGLSMNSYPSYQYSAPATRTIDSTSPTSGGSQTINTNAGIPGMSGLDQNGQALNTADQARPFGNAPVVDPNAPPQNASRFDQSLSQNNGLLSQYLQDYKSKIDAGDTSVNQASQAMLDFQKANANQMSQIQGDNNLSVDTQSGKGQVISDRFSKELPAYQQNTQNAITQRGQNIDAYNAMLGQVAPKQNGYVMMDPTTGQPIGGNGMGSAAFQGGQTNAQQQQGYNYQTNQAPLQSAQNIVQQFNSALQATPNFNPNDVNVINGFINAYQNNTSNPQYPQLQSQFNNAVAQYASILGPQTFPNLLTQSKGQTMSQFLSNLDSQAQAVQSGTKSAGTGSSSNGSSGSSNQYGGTAWQ